MAQVRVTYKYAAKGKTPSMTTNTVINVSSKTPTESEVSAVLKKKMPQNDFIILKIES